MASPGVQGMGRGHSPAGPQPLDLATVQSRPVGFRPMLPTTVSRTYCLCRGGKGRLTAGSQAATLQPTWAAHAFYTELFSQESAGA